MSIPTAASPCRGAAHRSASCALPKHQTVGGSGHPTITSGPSVSSLQSSSVRGKIMFFFPHPGGTRRQQVCGLHPLPSLQGHHLRPSLQSLPGPPLPSHSSHPSPRRPHPQSHLLTWTWPCHSPASATGLPSAPGRSLLGLSEQAPHLSHSPHRLSSWPSRYLNAVRASPHHRPFLPLPLSLQCLLSKPHCHLPNSCSATRLHLEATSSGKPSLIPLSPPQPG